MSLSMVSMHNFLHLWLLSSVAITPLKYEFTVILNLAGKEKQKLTYKYKIGIYEIIFYFHIINVKSEIYSAKQNNGPKSFVSSCKVIYYAVMAQGLEIMLRVLVCRDIW